MAGAGNGGKLHRRLHKIRVELATRQLKIRNPYRMTGADALLPHFNSRRTFPASPWCLLLEANQPTPLPENPGWKRPSASGLASLSRLALCHPALLKLPSPRPGGVFHAKLHNHNKLFTVFIGEIKPTHRCHVSQIPSVHQTGRLCKGDIPASKFRARWL